MTAEVRNDVLSAASTVSIVAYTMHHLHLMLVRAGKPRSVIRGQNSCGRWLQCVLRQYYARAMRVRYQRDNSICVVCKSIITRKDELTIIYVLVTIHIITTLYKQSFFTNNCVVGPKKLMPI